MTNQRLQKQTPQSSRPTSPGLSSAASHSRTGSLSSASSGPTSPSTTTGAGTAVPCSARGAPKVRVGPLAWPVWFTKKETEGCMSTSYAPTVLALGEEIHCFMKYATLTEEERSLRLDFQDTIEKVVAGLWPEATAELFGSFATGLSTPRSDIDIAVCVDNNGEEPTCAQLFEFADAMKEHDKTMETSVFAEAKVPIVRVFSIPFRTQGSGLQYRLQCDVTFVPSLEKVRAVVQQQKDFLEEFRVARPLVLLTKVLLKMWGLNAVRTGGLSSTSILLLVRRFLHLPKSVQAGAQEDESFDEDDDDFDELAPENLAIKLLQFWWHCGSPEYVFGFGLYDPNDSTNEVSAGTTRMIDVQQVLYGSAVSMWSIVENDSRGDERQNRKGTTKRYNRRNHRGPVLPTGSTLLSFFLVDPRVPPPPCY